MTQPAKTLVAALAALLLTSGSAFAQDGGMSDKERRKAAKEEQAKARADQEAAAAAEAAEAEAKAESMRLEEMGAAEGELFESKKGFFVSIDAFLADSSGAERTVAHVGDIVTSATTAEELDSDGDNLPDAFSIQNLRDLDLEYDSEISPRLEIGWRRGTGSVFSVRYWGYSSDASASASGSQSFQNAMGETALYLGAIDNQGFENEPGDSDTNPAAFERPFGSPLLTGPGGLHGAESVTASGTLDATRFDLLYTHWGLVRPRIELQYRIGLSLLNATREESATFTWRSFNSVAVVNDSVTVETVETEADTQAVGVVAGLAGRFGITENRKWAIRLGVELSGLTNEQDLHFRDTWVNTVGGGDPTPTVGQDVTSSPSNNLITTLDADVAFEGRVGSNLRLGIGYRHSDWLEAVTAQRFPNSANPALLEEEAIDVDFSGPYVRLSWYF